MKKALAVLLVFSMLLSGMSAVWAEDAQIRFSDIPEDYWGKETVDWAIENGLVQGFPDGTFRPNQEITLAEWATFIYRLNKADEWYTEELATRIRNILYLGWELSAKVKRDSWYYKPMGFYIAGFYGTGDYIPIHDAYKDKDIDIDPNLKMKRWMIISSMLNMHNEYGKQEVLENGVIKISAPKDRMIYGLVDNIEKARIENRLFTDAEENKDIDIAGTAIVKENPQAYDFFRWLVLDDVYVMSEAGFVKGMPDGTLRPNQVVTRIEALEFLRRIHPYLDVRGHAHFK